ncbi:MAG: TonB-dependent receptor [Candidatus Acidiferrales bacterium]
MRVRNISVCLAAFVLMLTLARPLFSQGTNQGSIQGTVTDPSGAAVPGANLTATDTQTGISVTSTSDADGLYTFLVVPVGTYTVVARKSGFATVTQENVIVTVGARLTLDLSMPLASQKSTVTVSGQAPIIETTKSEVSSTVNERSISDLPTNGRNFINFVLLTPGVTTDNRGGDISFAGQRGTLNSLIVDGSDNNNTFFGQSLGRTGSGRAPYQFSQDAVQEFQVNSNDYSAELGNAGGAVINVITKSGTNQFHGAAFEFYRDRALNANDPIQIAHGKPRQPYHFNQFGGDLGGPIVKDKLFFFFDYDGQRNTVANFVFLNGAPFCTVCTANQTTAINYLTARAAPWSSTFNQNVYLAKVDWHISSNEMLSARYNAQRFTGLNLENGGPQNSVEHTGASDVTSDTLTATLTSTLRPTLVNVFQFNYARDNEPGFANSDLPQVTVRNAGVTVFTAGRNFFSPRFTNIKRSEFDDAISWVHGAHTFKTGAHIMIDRIANFFPGNFSGQYTFNSLEAFGCNLNGGGASCFTGGDANDTFVQAFAGAGTTGPTTSPNLSEYSGFIQDEWRVRPNLTLNYGLRYDFDKIAQPPTLNPDPQLAAAGVVTNQIHNQRNEFGPRFGFAWTPLASNRLVVRGGYGIFYGRTPAITVGTAMSNNGLNVSTLTFFPASTPSIPAYPNNLCGAPTQSPSCAAPTGGTASPPIVFGFQKNYQEPNVQQFSIGTEYEINPNTAISITYLHVKGTHLTRTIDINLQGPEIPQQIGIAGTSTVLTYNQMPQQAGKPLGNPVRPFPNFSRIEEFQSNANSNYNGMTVQLTKRFAKNYQLTAGYTFGKVIDDAPDATSVVPFSFDDSKMVSDPLNIRADKGPGINDQRHRFVLSGVWNLNYASGMSSALARGILGGWELSGIFTAESGQPYSGLLGFDLNGDSNRSTDRTPGLGRNTFYTPKFISLDPRVTRNVNITERYKLQFIAEAFNAFNRANITGVFSNQFNVVSGAACTGTTTNTFGECLKPVPSFGTPSSTNINGGPGSRILQLAVKFVF